MKIENKNIMYISDGKEKREISIEKAGQVKYVFDMLSCECCDKLIDYCIESAEQNDVLFVSKESYENYYLDAGFKIIARFNWERFQNIDDKIKFAIAVCDARTKQWECKRDFLADVLKVMKSEKQSVGYADLFKNKNATAHLNKGGGF